MVSTGQGVLGNNMFAYCRNNPVNRVDPNGCKDKSVFVPGALVEALSAALNKTASIIHKTVITIPLKDNPAAVVWNGDGSSYDEESDVSVIARMLYGEDPNSKEAHLWMLDNRLTSGDNYMPYKENTYRGLALGEDQFDCMRGSKSLNPAGRFGSPGEKAHWDACVDMAYDFVYGGVSVIPYPDKFQSCFTWTHSYFETRFKVYEEYPNGERYGDTWFNDNVRKK
jgi:hypothetical protein